MAVTAKCTIEVPLVDFRRGLAAVRPHAERTKTGDEVNAFGRVRFIAGKDELLIVATNGVTSAMAAVEILADSRSERFAADDGAFSVDVSPTLTADLRSGLRIQRADIGEDEQTASLTFTDDTVTVRDVSGLWPGSETSRPTLPFSAEFPDVAAALRLALNSALQAVKPLTIRGEVFRLFAAAAAQYGKPLQAESTGSAESRGFLVWCGPRFIGTASSGHDDADSLSKRRSERRAHEERLGLKPALEVL